MIRSAQIDSSAGAGTRCRRGGGPLKPATVRRARSESGSVSVEAAIVLPMVVIFIAVLIAFGRVNLGEINVETAAHSAARAASLERSPQPARRAAQEAARTNLAASDLRCTSVTVRLDTSALTRPAGRHGSVSATVTCTVTLSDLALPGLPGSRTVTARASAPVDTYRGRS